MNHPLPPNVRRLLMSLLLALCLLTAVAQEFTVGYVTYLPRTNSEVAIKQITIPENNPDSLLIDIPEQVSNNGTNYTVTALGTASGCGSVMLYKGFTSVHIVRIPSTVRYVYAGTFAGCKSSTWLEFLPNRNIKSWPVGMFKDSPLGRLVLPEGVWTAIPADFCRNKPPLEVILPSNCRSIGAYAFASTSDDPRYIKHIELNYGLQSVAHHAFYNTSPRTEQRLWQNGTYTLTIPSSVTSIGESSFEGMRDIYHIEIPGSIKTIPKRAFAHATKTRNIVIGEGVERIEQEAFAQNGSQILTPYGYTHEGVYDFTLPSTVNYIGSGAFKQAELLQGIYVYSATPPTLQGDILNADEYNSVGLYVSQLYAFSCQQLPYWKNFKHIKPFSAYWSSTVAVSQNTPHGGIVSGSGSYKQGSRAQLSASPAAGYRFVGWMRDDAIVSTNTEYQFIASGSDVNVLAVFAPNSGASPTRPDDVYTRIYPTNGSDRLSFSLLDMAPRYGAQRATNWQFDIPVTPGDNNNSPRASADVIYTHAHPDKYAAETSSMQLKPNTINRTFSTEYGFSTPSFPLQSERDADGNILPSCTVTLRLPVVNTKTQQRDTISYTADVFLQDVDDPTVSFMTDGIEINAMKRTSHDSPSPQNSAPATNAKRKSRSIIYDGANYYADTYAKGLDTKYGFDIELNITRSKDGKSEVVKNIKKHYGAGEFNPDNATSDYNDGQFNPYFDLNSRYVSMRSTLEGQVASGYNYTFNLRARNYDANGKPRGWIQRTVMGQNTQEVDVSKLDAECVKQGKWVPIKDDVTYFDNKNEADYNAAQMYDLNTNGRLAPANRGYIRINSYPDSWGAYQFCCDDPSSEDGKTVLKEGTMAQYTISSVDLDIPKDGRSHNYYLRWPKIGLERKVVFTDHTPQAVGKYRFDLYLRGGATDKIKDLYMVYETADGEINGKLIKYEDWSARKYEPRFLIEESRIIKRVISLADTVPIGSAHIVPVPSTLESVKSYQTYLNSDGNNIRTIINNIMLYGVKEIYFRLKDATNGKTITKGISLDETKGEVLADGTVKVLLDINTDNVRPIINADGYVPYYFRNGLNIYGNKVDADGYVGYIDNDGKITVTLPMRRRVGSRPFDVVNVYYRTPGIETIKDKYAANSELPWQSVRYSGANTKMAYEGSFQPKTYLDWNKSKTADVPTIAITVAFYDTSYNISHNQYGKTDDNVFGPVMSYLNLKSKKQNKSWRLYIAPRIYSMNRLDVFTQQKAAGIWAEDREIHGFKEEYYGLDDELHSRYLHDPNYKHTLVTYVFSPKNIVVQPEQEDTLYLSLSTGHEIMLGTFKNLTENSMYLASEAQTEAPVGEERISGMANLEDLDQFNDAFRKFDIDMPKNTAAYNPKKFDGLDIELPTQGALLPFNIGVQRINNDIVVRGILSYNFLPGGPVMDLVDKTDMASDIDKLFFDIQRTITRDDTEYEREDRALGFSTAFVGVRGWLEGRLSQNARGYWVPQAVGMGIKAEASGFFNGGIYTPFFRSNLTLGGELSTYAAIDAAPDTTGLGWAVNKNAKYLCDMVQHTTVSMNTSLSVGAGIDIYIARAICGVKGSLSASFDSEVRYRPYLQGARRIYDSMQTKPEIGVPSSYTYSGSRMQVSGKVKAFAEAKFLWWKVRKEATLASFNKKWYDPNNSDNPLWVADHNEEKTQSVLRSSVYRPLRLSAAPENTSIILRDIDTYAEPRYLFGGKNLAYYKINAEDMRDAHIMFRNGDSFNGGNGEPIVTADVSSTDSKGIIAYEVSTADADKITDETEAPKHMGIKAALNNGAGWTTPVMLTGAEPANYMPRTAIDDDGKAVVAWKGGEFVASDYADAEKAGMVSGALYMSRYDGSKWGEAVRLASTVKGYSVSDYAMAMLDGKPYMLATFGRNTSEGGGLETEHTLAAIGYSGDDESPMLVDNNIEASSPQLVSFGGKLFGAALVREGGVSEEGDTTEVKTDVHLYSISTDGMIEDLGAMGLHNHNLADFRLVKSDKAMALIWRESTQILNETTNQLDITPSVYGALLRSATTDNGTTTYFVSCPQLIAKAEGNLDISFYDAYLPDESSMTGVVTLYDSETGGANVVESTNYFDNDFTIRHAGIDTKVERGTDYGYYVVVFNEGKDVIDYVDLKFGDNATTRTIQTSIYPGHDAVLTDEALYTADIENGIEPKVTPHFNESSVRIRTYAEALAATEGTRKVNRRRINRRQKAPTATPKVQLQVVDMNVKPLSVIVAGSDKYYEASADTVINVPDAGQNEFADNLPDNYTSVLVNVMNDSPVSLKHGYRTNVSLYYDMKGQKPYEYAHGVEISASQFKADGGSSVARILVGKVPEDVMLFAVAVTTDAEGNIVKDQDMLNNASPVRLEKNQIEEVPDGIEEVVQDRNDDATPAFEVAKAENGAVVTGLAVGETLRVYDTAGVLLHLYSVKADSEQHFVRLPKHGVYIFSNGRQSVKFGF